ncbi:hypothetical protein [Comamonas sp. JC664]|uniref:DUF7151 family protein n=1 Tax=Comamonas sp. JC664 TaxID=2801917 RepID=UPI00174CB192|nr:hypothetical protein [Comamonas sp. JC664]MBL0698594.1 hypothetical protein [Comamonas sp. JC664]GHH00636.1 hypothetical protein GCM10012319_68000 [Comamonas sp. KCTC 72670]
MRWTWLAVVVLASGCEGIDLRKLVTQHEVRTRMADEPAGAHCPAGGRALHAGLDLNDNGVLDDDEVTSTEYVCGTGVEGLLVHLQTLPPGEQCPFGGHVSRAGQDVNGNGVLDEGEVTREVHGCTERVTARVLHRSRHVPPLPETPPWKCGWGDTWVEAGPDVNGNGLLDDDEVRAMTRVCTDPARLQVNHHTESAGTTCTEGGARIEVGDDADEDGVLVGHEIQGTAFVCEALHTLHGDYTVRTPADLAVLQRISRVQGALLIDETALTEVRLPGLAVVDRTFRIWNNPFLTQIDLPGLRFVGDDLDVSANQRLGGLKAGGAEYQRLFVGRSFVLSGNPQLKRLNGLAAVSPRLSMLLKDNTTLEFHPGEDTPFVSIDLLQGSLEVTGNETLQALPFRQLFHVRDVQISGNASLRTLEGLNPESITGSLVVAQNEALREVTGLSRVEHLSLLTVEDNPLLTGLTGLSALRTVASLHVENNASLVRFDLPNLSQVHESFIVRDNARLPTCLASALSAAVYTGEAKRLDISGNDDAASCPP